jgi:hypothetical protein
MTHFYHNLDADMGALARCLAMIEKHAPRLMRAGGGGLRREMLHAGRRLTHAQRDSITAALRASGGTGILRISRDHGVSHSTVRLVRSKMEAAT